MAARNNIFTTIRTEGALLPPDLLQRISEGATLDGLTPESYHRPGEKLNEAINRSWNALQGAWASFRAAQERLPENDLGTSITRERWLLPLFRELDYGRLQIATAVEIDGRSYPISHGWEHVPVHLVSYQLELDKRTPGAAGAASASPHSLLQVFLNRSDDNLWGFLSNGYKLRILRDNMTLTRQAYVEFDLEAMMEGEVYSDFVLLWLLCHQSRVEGERPSDCWLEKWMKVAEDQGTRALDQLRDGVEAAITALGLGFLEYPANHQLRDQLTSGDLNAQDYYRQLLRMVYRLLFLFVAEDRDLLLNPAADTPARERYVDYYSTQRLRRMAETFKGTRHADLFESLRLVMRLLSGDIAPTPGPSPSGGGEKQVSPPHGERFREGAVREIATQAMRDIARELRQRQTPAEEIMWEALRKNRLGGLGFRRQHAVANTNYVVDFFCYSENLIVELDGEIHQFQQGEDRQRQAELESLGYRVLRFSNDRIFNDLENVLTEILTPTQVAQVSPPEGGRFRGGANLLALIPLGSFLFSDAAVTDIIDCQISNQHLLTAIRALSLTYDQRAQVYRTVDYKNLGSDELGSIFESLLELHPQINVPARRFALSTAAGNERKTTGSYYTPESLVHALLDSALNPVLEEAVRPHSKSLSQGERDLQSPGGLPSPLGRRDGDEGQTPEERILALKVCDPACGSGHFLIAAANRMAKALAYVRTGEEEPPPAAIQEAKRDIISHCIYGVDINPMAVELCKVNLWMEALEPGKPLNFLDHRIQVGNSLLGTTPKLMAGGIPDDAFNPIEGDDPKFTSSMRKQNREERKQREAGVRQIGLFEAPAANYSALSDATRWIDRAPDDTLGQVRIKEQMYQRLASDPEYVKARLLADAWCAAFVWEKKASKAPTPGPGVQSQGAPPSGGGETAGSDEVLPHEGEGFRMGAKGAHFSLPMTDLLYRRMEENPLADNLQAIRQYVVELKERYQFFHWHVAFPDVFTVPDEIQRAENEQTGWHGGFDCILGNPPWERIKLSEREFFGGRNAEIADISQVGQRRTLIEELRTRDPFLWSEYQSAMRSSEGINHFLRTSGNFPLLGAGDINTYSVFVTLATYVMSALGYTGLIVPTGIATDNINQEFFAQLIENGQLVKLVDFENREALFAGVHRSYRFALLTIQGMLNSRKQMLFGFFLGSSADLKNADRFYELTTEDFRRINPNTLTCPAFRTKKDADITRAIYMLFPVFTNDYEATNPWQAKIYRLLDANENADLMCTEDELLENGFERNASGDFQKSSEVWLRVYEGKMIDFFNHRLASTYTVEGSQRSGRADASSRSDLMNINYVADVRYWVSKHVVEERMTEWGYNWFLAFMDVVSSSNQRTMISSIIPLSAPTKSLRILRRIGEKPEKLSALLSNFCSFCFDFVVRQSVTGLHLSEHIVKQLPIIPPHTYTPDLLDFIVPRVLELTYTAWDLQPFAQDVGWDGPPFVWDEERRFLMRCELDALYFHLYQISRDDVDYIMETFPIVKRKDEAAHGEYLTKRIILEMYDQMAALPTMHVPAPKDESTTYAVPDVSGWETWLEPGPADPAVAHEE